MGKKGNSKKPPSRKNKGGGGGTAPSNNNADMDTEDVQVEDAMEAEGEDGAAVRMTAKEKQRLKMESKRKLKVSVGQFKQERNRLNKKDFAQKAERRQLTREMRNMLQMEEKAKEETKED
mmetsp:Transcript_17904/g.21441  ORF Transcript_17904/g.21441 Transcript_17904/m.21441 type:complete len:120 (-) Transcript_17904:1-360(-)